MKKMLLPEKNGIFFDQSVSIEFHCEGIVKKKNEKIEKIKYRKNNAIKCKYMFLNVQMEKSVREENGHVFCCSVLNPVLF